MKRQIRRSVFETNSSSVHAISLCSKEDYDKFKKGKMYIDYNMHILSREEAISRLKECAWISPETVDWTDKDEVDEILYNEEYKTYDQYDDYTECQFETFEMKHTTENGDEVVAFGYYGYDG